MDQKSKATSALRDELADIGAGNLKSILATAGGRFSGMSIADAREVVEIILDHSSYEKIAQPTRSPGRR